MSLANSREEVSEETQKSKELELSYYYQTRK